MAQDVTVAGAIYSDVPALALPKTGGGTAMFYDASGINYASSPTSGGNANMTNAILYGAVDSNSTATAFTATVAGLTTLVDGTTIALRNGVVTSASGFTIDVNGLGALPVYNNMATGNAITPTAPTRDTTIFNINYTMLFTYVESDIVEGGCWICWRGYDGNTNTIGYQLRGNSSTLPASDKGYRYRLWFTSADGTKWVPANKSTSTNATASRTPNTTPIDPFGPIVYYSTNGTTNAGANLTATTIWTQYTLSLGYSFNTTGAALVMTYPAPVYVKCTPAANGSATLDGYVQALPSTNDGKIYIFLGRAYNATNIELFPEHPVYYHDGTGIRLWTGAEGGGSTVTVTQSLSSGTQVASISVDGTATALYAPTPPTASTTTPSMDGTASYGSGTSYARSNHVHPTDTSRQATLVSGTNIKTINGNSLLGSGDLTISGGSSSWDDITGKPFSTAPAISASFSMTQTEADDNGHVVTTSWVPTVGETYSAMKDGAAYTLNCIARGTGNNAKPFLVVSGYTYATSPWTISWPGYFINVEQYRDKTGYYNNSSYEAETVSSLTVGSSETINSDAIPPATATSLGGVKVGSGLAIAADGTLSLDVASASGVSF